MFDGLKLFVSVLLAFAIAALIVAPAIWGMEVVFHWLESIFIYVRTIPVNIFGE